MTEILFTRKPFQNSRWLVVSMSVLKAFQDKENMKWWSILCCMSVWSTAQCCLGTSVFRNTGTSLSHRTPLLQQDRTVPSLWSFYGFFFHLQAQIAKGGSKWLTDSLLWLLNKGPFKDMPLRINRQNYQVLAYCWFTVENHLNRHSSSKIN